MQSADHDCRLLIYASLFLYITGQQFILYLLLQFGSIQFVSLLVLYVRRSAFINRFGSSAPESSQSTTTKSNRHNHWWWPHKSIWLMEDEEMKIANRILDDPDETPQLDEEGMKCERRKRKRRYNERRRQKMENGNGTNEGPAQNMCKANGTHDHEGIEMRRIESPTSMASGDYASRPMMNHPVSSQKRRGRISRTSRPEDGTPVSATSSSHIHRSNKPLQRMRQRATDDGRRRSTTRSGAAAGKRGNTGISNNTTASSTARHSGTGSGANNTKYAHHTSARGGFPNPIHAIFSEGVYQLKKRTANSSSNRSGSASDFDIYRTRTGNGLPRSDTRASRFSQPTRGLIRLRGSSTAQNGNVYGNEDIEATAGQSRAGKLSANDNKLEKVPTRQVSLPHSGYRFGRNSTVRDLSRDAHLKLAHLEVSCLSLRNIIHHLVHSFDWPFSSMYSDIRHDTAHVHHLHMVDRPTASFCHYLVTIFRSWPFPKRVRAV